jgi:hypothetical protein
VHLELVVAFHGTAVEAEPVLEARAPAALDRDAEDAGLAGRLGLLQLADLLGRAGGELDEGFDGCHGLIVPEVFDGGNTRLRDTRYTRG